MSCVLQALTAEIVKTIRDIIALNPLYRSVLPFQFYHMQSVNFHFTLLFYFVLLVVSGFHSINLVRVFCTQHLKAIYRQSVLSAPFQLMLN